MRNQIKTIGVICIVACVLCVVWGMVGMAYAIPSEAQQYRFDGVYAVEGTVLTVKNGQLVLIGGSNFAVDRPVRRIVNLSLWGLCFLMTLISGVVLLRLAKYGSITVTTAKEIRIDQKD
jgi:hypothetical protein